MRKIFSFSVFLGLLLLSILPVFAQGVSGGKLPTRWDKDVSASNPLPEYPRPQMIRDNWQNLNGQWEYGLTDKAAIAPPAAYDGKILVPYPYESALSGIGKGTSVPDQRLWYRRRFTVPAGWRGQRVLLHFGAVNWDSTVAVNGTALGTHQGGYDAFEYDITDALKPGANELVVSAWNPVITDGPNSQVTGKQRLKSEGYAYTACTGIWQTVWLEPVPTTHISGLKITPDIDAKVLRLTVQTEGRAADCDVLVTTFDGPGVLSRTSGQPNAPITIPVANPHLWTPDDPHLYDLRIYLTQNGKPALDTVSSYFALRKVSLGKDAQGRTVMCLNNKPLFQVGALDQGYWPDGIYTAPTDAALRYDIDEAKALGFNLLRKHAKVEPDRWYYWTDKIGMLVWQDMPQAFGDGDKFSAPTKAQWLTEWQREIASHYNHPSIIVWTTFNENWGQHDTEAIVALTKRLDPTRLVNNASGFVDKGVGDIADTHDYPGPGSGRPEPSRAAVCGEFGGITRLVPGHRWDHTYVGYGGLLKNDWQMDRRYQQLLKRAYALSDTQGTSAVVYTQITDVEEESNGLMTYDRAVVKADPVYIAAANNGRFPPLPPNPNHDFLPTSEDDPQIWQYTTDKPVADWTKPGFDASAWKSGPAPFGAGYASSTDWKTADIWLRREVTLPAVVPAKLDVVMIHDEDVEVYVNGVLAASAPGYVGDYVRLPMNDAARAALKPGKNLIAVHCHQTVGGQVIDVGLAEAGR